MTDLSKLRACQSGPLTGRIVPPGDKSISHRSIMLGGIAQGRTIVRGLLEGEDVLATVAALRSLGATIVKQGDAWIIDGVGLENLREASDVLDMGNSGTSTRLLIGLLGARPMTSFFTGDASLRGRPMRRVIDPLSLMGASFSTREGGRLPLAVRGPTEAQAITYELPVASAQVKSAVLLAGLSALGETRVIERVPTRDHSERMLRAFGADLRVEKIPEGEVISVVGHPVLRGQTIEVPADISSAAFPMAASLLCEGSNVMLANVGMNERRAGIVESLLEMGASIEKTNERDICGEPVADLIVRGTGPLRGAVIPASRAPSMIDEYPALAMVAACAVGTSRFCGLSELRVKESDRLALVADGLTASGVRVEVEGDDLIIHGTGRPPAGGATIATALDHRIAMSFLVLGLATDEPIAVDDARPIATSFPGFTDLMRSLGAKIDEICV